MHHLPSKPLLIIFAVNIAAAVLWFSSSHQSQAAGNTYYVSKQGSDSNSCISAGSGTCLTITGGASKMSGGDTLLIQAGTYNENMEWQTFPWRTGNASTYTRYARYQNDVVTIVGQGSGAGSGSKTISFYNNSNYIEIDGLAFDGVNTDGVVRVETPAHHIRIKNSVLKNAPVGCWPNTPSIIGAQGGTNIEFLNNDIYGAAVGYGIYMATSDSVMDGNRIHDNGQYGIHMYSDHCGVNNNTIRNNTIYNNGYTPAQNCDGGTQSHGVGLLVGSGTGHLVYNNLIYDNYYALSAQYGGCGDIQIYNNTIYNNQGASDATSIHVSGCPNTTIRNNIVYRNIGGISCVDGAQCTSSNNLTSDPNFISSSDFHLQSSSPAKDAGVSLPEVPCDFDGNGRPAGSAYDIGAYEQGGTPGSGCTKGSGGITPPRCPINLRWSALALPRSPSIPLARA
jgi:parallel beta-helix repeat protein